MKVKRTTDTRGRAHTQQKALRQWKCGGDGGNTEGQNKQKAVRRKHQPKIPSVRSRGSAAIGQSPATQQPATQSAHKRSSEQCYLAQLSSQAQSTCEQCTAAVQDMHNHLPH
jgi:hypothetical protein